MRLIIMFLALLYYQSLLYANPPPNLSCVKLAIIHYYRSHQFEKDVATLMQTAKKNLDSQIKKNKLLTHPKKLAIMFDIDDTLISNFGANFKRDFANSESGINENYRRANSPAIRPVLQFYNYALKNGVAVFIISYRPLCFKKDTLKNLARAGYRNWTKLYLANPSQLKVSARAYKLKITEQLRQAGYRMVMAFGDQDCDLSLEYAENLYQIPNPLYKTSNNSCKPSDPLCMT